MKKSSTSILLIISVLALSFFTSCGEDDVPVGKISVLLDANDAFKSPNSDQTGSTTSVVWGCLVLDETTTACLYYYNGEMQVDGNMSADAIDAGPGTTGFTFVAPLTEFSELEGGERTYSHFSAIYDNSTGNPIETPFELNGTFDLYANVGEDIDWMVSFGNGANPIVDTR